MDREREKEPKPNVNIFEFPFPMYEIAEDKNVESSANQKLSHCYVNVR